MNCKHLGITAWLLLASLAMAQTASAQRGDTLIRSVFLDLDTDPPTVSIHGVNFGNTEGVAAFATSHGLQQRLTNIAWSDTAITADLPPTPPGNYNVLVIKASAQFNALVPHDFGVMAVTVVAPATEVPDQSCPPGQVANGVVSGLLQCEELRKLSNYLVEANNLELPVSDDIDLRLECDTGDIAVSTSWVSDPNRVQVRRSKAISDRVYNLNIRNNLGIAINENFSVNCLDLSPPFFTTFKQTATCVPTPIGYSCSL